MKLRPRFSVRTLAVVVTLVCAYFGAWEATKKQILSEEESYSQIDRFEPRVWDRRCIIPLLISQNQTVSGPKNWEEYHRGIRFKEARCYYLWILGPKIRLPFESSVE